jgi:hypothetical protein
MQETGWRRLFELGVPSRKTDLIFYQIQIFFLALQSLKNSFLATNWWKSLFYSQLSCMWAIVVGERKVLNNSRNLWNFDRYRFDKLRFWFVCHFFVFLEIVSQGFLLFYHDNWSLYFWTVKNTGHFLALPSNLRC